MFTLSDLSTRELLNARIQARNYDSDPTLVGCRAAPGGQYMCVYATLNEILEELNQRGHVPSKKEAKILRKLQAKTGQSVEWLRAHPKYGQEIMNAMYPNRREVTAEEYTTRVSIYGSHKAAELFKIKK